MNWPERVRSAINTLLGSELVVELRREIEELKTQRDYFKARADRLELVLLAPKVMSQPPAPRSDAQIVTGRKSWKQIQEEHAEQHKREMAEAAAKKVKEQN